MGSRELLQGSVWRVAVAGRAKKGGVGPKRACWDQKQEQCGNGLFQRETEGSTVSPQLTGVGSGAGAEDKRTRTRP